MKQLAVRVQSETGLHARPASQFVTEASRYSSEIKVQKNEKLVNGKSIMGILGLCVNTGDEIIIIAEGEDEAQAIEGINLLFEGGL